MYGNIFYQFMENRWGYLYLSHSWILRDFSCVFCFKYSKFSLAVISWLIAGRNCSMFQFSFPNFWLICNFIVLGNFSNPSKHSSWWRRLSSFNSKDVFKTSLRRLDEDDYILINIRPQKTSSRRLQDVLVKTNIFLLSIRLQDVFKTSCHNVFKTFSRHLQDVFKKSCKNVFKTSSRRGGRGGSSCNGVLILPKLSH